MYNPIQSHFHHVALLFGGQQVHAGAAANGSIKHWLLLAQDQEVQALNNWGLREWIPGPARAKEDVSGARRRI